jgi:hypothetical protein
LSHEELHRCEARRSNLTQKCAMKYECLVLIRIYSNFTRKRGLLLRHAEAVPDVGKGEYGSNFVFVFMKAFAIHHLTLLSCGFPVFIVNSGCPGFSFGIGCFRKFFAVLIIVYFHPVFHIVGVWNHGVYFSVAEIVGVG